MSYRTDSDLQFLQYASNEDLLLLADTLLYSNEKEKKKGSHRFASTLFIDKNFNASYPNNMRRIWKPIAEELQKFGGHSGVNWLFRSNQGVLYREILMDVCKMQKVKIDDIKHKSTSDIENIFLQKIIEIAVEAMSEKERRELIDGLRQIDGFSDALKNTLISPQSIINALQMVFKAGGFQSYILTLQIVNGISRALFNRGLSFGANAALTKAIGSFMSGPVGWAWAIGSTAWGFMGPNRDVCIRAVTIVAYMRKKYLLGYK